MTQLMSKRIPVSENLWKKLGKLKEAGQTYNDLIEKMIQAYNRKNLIEKAKSAKKGKGNWINLDNI